MEISIAHKRTKRIIRGEFMLHGNYADLRKLAKKILEVTEDKDDHCSSWITIPDTTLEEKFLGKAPIEWE